MAQDGQTPDAPETSPADRQPRRIHWRSGLGILIGGAIAEVLVLRHYADDDTLKIYVTLKFVFPIVAGLFILWWFFRSGFSWRIRGGGALVTLLLFVCFFLRYRIDGFDGAMRPIVSLRSDPTPEQRTARYFKTATSQSTTPDVDTEKITAADWPRFRGPRGDGIVRDLRIRVDWNDHPPRQLWRHPVGPAWSTFIAVGELLFTQEQRGPNEAVVCYGAETGNQIWVHTDVGARYDTLLGGTGPRATPTYYDSLLYTLGATGILNCLDAATGNVRWSTNILEDAGSPGEPAVNLDWGMSGSPLVYGDVVVVNPGGEQGKAVIAYDRFTGKQKWAAGDERAGYAGVRREIILGHPQLLVYDAAGVAGMNEQSGTELWRFSWTNSDRINVAQPIVRDERFVFISSGYGTGSALLQLTSDSSGQWHADPRWRKPGRFKLKFNDAVYKDGYVYGLDEGILACLDYETGKIMWKRGRYGHGQLLLIDKLDLLLIQAEDGKVVLVPATAAGHREVARIQALPLNKHTWNHPLLNRGRLYVRNFEEAACYDVRHPDDTKAADK